MDLEGEVTEADDETLECGESAKEEEFAKEFLIMFGTTSGGGGIEIYFDDGGENSAANPAGEDGVEGSHFGTVGIDGIDGDLVGIYRRRDEVGDRGWVVLKEVKKGLEKGVLGEVLDSSNEAVEFRLEIGKKNVGVGEELATTIEGGSEVTEGLFGMLEGSAELGGEISDIVEDGGGVLGKLAEVSLEGGLILLAEVGGGILESVKFGADSVKIIKAGGGLVKKSLKFGDARSELRLEGLKVGVIRKIIEFIKGRLSGSLELGGAIAGGGGKIIEDGDGLLKGGEGLIGGVGGELGGLEDGAELGDFSLGVVELSNKIVGGGRGLVDEAGVFSGINGFVNNGIDEGLVNARLDGLGGLVDHDGGDGVFLVVDIEIESGFAEISVIEKRGELLTKIGGDNNGAIIGTLFHMGNSIGAVGKDPMHSVVLVKGISNTSAHINSLIGDSGAGVFVDDGDRDTVGVAVRIPVGIDIEPSVNTGNKRDTESNNHRYFAFSEIFEV